MFARLMSSGYRNSVNGLSYCRNGLMSGTEGVAGRVSRAFRDYRFSIGQKIFNFKFGMQTGILENGGHAARSKESNQGWHISSWALMVFGSLVTYLLIDDGAQASAEEKEETEPIQGGTRIVVVTMANFGEVIALLMQNSPTIRSLRIDFVLTEAQLGEFYNAIKDNRELGYISWHKDQIIYENARRIETKLIDNNKNYRAFPTDYVFGLLSTHVYMDVEEGSSVTIDASVDGYLKNWKVWKVYNDTKGSGYYGVIYKNEETHQFVLAHRGTEGGVMGILTDAVKQNSDWKTNLNEILIGRVVIGQQARNYQATYEAVEIAKREGYELSITGHSLGGWLGELSAFYCHAYFEYPYVKTVTFDSPGALPMMEKLQTNLRDRDLIVELEDIKITSYLTFPNPINTCNRHPGKTYQIAPDMEWTDWANNTIPDFIKRILGNDKIEGYLAYEGHALAGILKTFDPETGKPVEYRRMADWPRMRYTGEGRDFNSEGSELMTKTLDKLDLSPIVKRVDHGLEMAGGKALKTEVLDKLGIDSTSIVKKGLGYGIDYLIGDTTLMAMVGFLANLNQVDQEQYWAYYRYINAKGNESDSGSREKIAYDNRFALVAKAKYREADDINILNLKKGSVDDYLYELNKARDSLDKVKDFPEIVRVQLQDLLSSFTIKRVGDGKYSLVPNAGCDGEVIRQRMERLLCVVPRVVMDTVQSRVINQYKTVVELAEGAEIKDKRVTKVAEHLPLETPNYVEMEGKRKELEESLEVRNVALISGPRGMGKTTLAAKYGKDCKHSGWQVRWIKGARIHEEFLKLAKDLNIKTDNLGPEEIRDLVYGGLERFTKKRILLVIDNAKDWKEIKQYLVNLPNHVKVVITSRQGNLLQEIGVRPIIVKGFGRKEAVFYMQEALGKDKREAERLVEAVTESPFRLSKVVAYLKKHSLMSIDDFIEDYEAIKMGKHQDEEIYPEVELLFRDLKKQSPKSWQLLKYSAYLDAEGVPLELVSRLMGKSLVELQESVNALEELALMNVVVDGRKRSLKVSHRIIWTEARKALIEEDGSQPQKILRELIFEVDRILPKMSRNPKNLMEVAPWLSHVHILIEEAERIGLPFIDRKDLVSKLGKYYYAMGVNRKETLRYWQELLDYYKNVHEENHPDVVNALNNIGLAYLELGTEEGIRSGIAHLEESLERGQKLFPGDNPEVAMLLNNLGVAYQKLEGKEDIREGIKYLGASLKMYKNAYSKDDSLKDDLTENSGLVASVVSVASISLGVSSFIGSLIGSFSNLFSNRQFYSNYPETALVLTNLGDAYQKLGGKSNVLLALECQKLSLGMRQRLFPGNHPDVARSLNSVGYAYCELGGEKNIRKGIKYLTRSSTMNKELFLNKHSQTAQSLNQLGVAYLMLGGEKNVREGLKCVSEALKICRELPSDNRSIETIFLHNLGVAYSALGGEDNILEGLKHSNVSLDLCKAIFPDKHFQTAQTLNGIGVEYRELGGKENIQEGLRRLNESLERISGNDFLTARVLYNIGLAHLALKGKEDVQEGLRRSRECLKICKELFTEDNHQTALALNSISVACRELGGEYMEEGWKKANQSLTMLQRLFPSNHPDVGMALNNLGAYYSVLGDGNNALELKKQAYGIYLATFREDYKKTKEIKSDIELLEPGFFKSHELGQKIEEKSGIISFRVVGPECRKPIFFKGELGNDSIVLKQRIQKTVLSEVVKIVDSHGWSYAFPWADYGVKGYLEEKYLREQLKELGNSQINIEFAKMYVFEAMNLGVIKSKNKPYEVVEAFTRANPELVKKIALENPEFFVDGSIAAACVRAMPEDEAFAQHINKHVRYMGTVGS